MTRLDLEPGYPRVVVRYPTRRECAWVYKSGWAKGLKCGADAWVAVNGEPRCNSHKRAALERGTTRD